MAADNHPAQTKKDHAEQDISTEVDSTASVFDATSLRVFLVWVFGLTAVFVLRYGFDPPLIDPRHL